MKLKIFLLFALAFCALGANAQSGTFIWTDGAPTAAPPASGAQFAVDRNTFDWYEWSAPRIGPPSWISSGERVQKTLGCVPPNYTPGKNLSTIVINDCDSLYHYRDNAWRHLNPGGAVRVDAVADSMAFRAYRGAADVVIMQDTARGGEFAKCVPCIADNYMVFTDGNGNKWRRINYDRILESWWGKWGHTSLQRAINYVAQNKVGTVGVLTHNQDITLKDSVNVWDGVQIHGTSPPLVPGSHPLDSPAKNVIRLDLNDANKGAIVWNDNGRGYSDGTLIKGVGIVAVSPCRAALVIKKPNGGNISDIFIFGGSADIAQRKITNGIEVSGTVYSNWNNINIFGARTGIKELPTIFSGGTLTITGVSSVRRCVTAIDMAAYGAIFATGLFLENIDTVGIRTNWLFWSGAYTENAPMAANGTLIQTINSDAFINVQNVKFNGGTDCITGNCAVFDGPARHVILLNNEYFNINRIIRSPRMPQSGIVRGGVHYNVTTWTQNIFGVPRWSCGEILQYSGGIPEETENWYTGKHRFMSLMDKDNSTGLADQVLKSNGDETMSWTDLPSSIPPGTTGQVLRYDSPTTVTGEPNLFWDAAQVRFGIGTTSPTRRLTVQDPANAYLQVRGENNGGIELYISNASPNAAWDSYASRGNLITPTATNAGNTLGQFRFFGHTGSAYRQAANIQIINTVNSSPSNGVPTDMVFGVTRPGFGGATNRLWLKSRGYFSVGTETPSGYLTVRSDDSGVPNVRLISSAGDSTGIYVRSTTPEGAQAAPPGSLSILTDGSLFSKRTGTGNTGWGEFFNMAKSYGATIGQVPKWNGTTWVPANDSIGGGGGTYTAGTGIGIAGNVISNTGDLSATNEAQNLTAGTNTVTLSQVSGVGGGTATVDTDPTNDITGIGASGRIPFFSGTQTVTSDAGLTWDNTNKRLGVNQATTAAQVHITGTDNVAATNTLLVENLAGNDALRINNTAEQLFLGPYGGGLWALSNRMRFFENANVNDYATIEAERFWGPNGLGLEFEQSGTGLLVRGLGGATNTIGSHLTTGSGMTNTTSNLTGAMVSAVVNPTSGSSALTASAIGGGAVPGASFAGTVTGVLVSPRVNNTNSATRRTVFDVGVNSVNNPTYATHTSYWSTHLGGATVFGGATPNASAIVDIQSTIGGFKPPSMTTTQRDAIASPAPGLELYNTTAGRAQVNTGQWETVLSGIPYTPTGSADPAGVVGSTAWDANFFYIKTASGWRRSALSTF